MDEKIDNLSDSTEEWKERKAILRSPKGIGPVISASFQGKRRIWGGREDVRSLLYMATLSALKSNPPIRAFYQHLLDKGKVKKVAIIACMRKFLLCLNAMVKNNEPWDDDKVTAFFKTA